ncbi:MAG: nuclear transport factor 2 family protein [Muricauda sp.]|nr:nuclear transport factor 2 family protein [Allomuricauda sp.]MBA4745985.1 nuclear transport factor 2 family protein [Allomuricauda sp.]
MRKLIVVSLLLLFTEYLGAQGMEKKYDAIDQKAKAQILMNFKYQEECWNNQDLVCYMEAYSKTDRIQTISSGGVTFGYDHILSNYQRYFPKDRMGQLRFDQFNFRKLSRKLCFVTGRFNLEFKERGKPVQGWFSVVMQRENGKWAILTDHSS